MSKQVQNFYDSMADVYHLIFEDWDFNAEYRCLLRTEVDATLRAAGFAEIEWFVPKDCGFYQPIVTATSI
jgi:hypothetical protein